MKTGTKVLLGILSIVGVIALSAIIKVVLFPVHVASKSIDVAYGVADKTLTVENAIYNYEWFKDREGEIRALYKQEERAKQELDDFKKLFPDSTKWTRDDKTEYSRLRSNLTGIGQMLDKAIEDYNAKSGMVNRNIFKDNLPSNISRAFYVGMELQQ